jgi:hypothetical protein
MGRFPPCGTGRVTRRSIRAESSYPEYSGPENCHAPAWGGAGCVPANVVSRESHYNLSRSQKSVKVQDLYCVQMRAMSAVASAKAGVGVHRPLRICLECRSKSWGAPLCGVNSATNRSRFVGRARRSQIPPWRGKNHDKQLTHIVRVRLSPYFFKSRILL